MLLLACVYIWKEEDASIWLWWRRAGSLLVGLFRANGITHHYRAHRTTHHYRANRIKHQYRVARDSTVKFDTSWCRYTSHTIVISDHPHAYALNWNSGGLYISYACNIPVITHARMRARTRTHTCIAYYDIISDLSLCSPAVSNTDPALLLCYCCWEILALFGDSLLFVQNY